MNNLSERIREHIPTKPFVVFFEAGNKHEGMKVFIVGFDDFGPALRFMGLIRRAKRITEWCHKRRPLNGAYSRRADELLRVFAGEPGMGRIISDGRLVNYSNKFKHGACQQQTV